MSGNWRGIECIRGHKSGKQEVETVWVVKEFKPRSGGCGSLPRALARQYWSIENGLRYRLEESGTGGPKPRVKH